MWLLERLQPDLKTIADFRKDNNYTPNKIKDYIRRMEK